MSPLGVPTNDSRSGGVTVTQSYALGCLGDQATLLAEGG